MTVFVLDNFNDVPLTLLKDHTPDIDVVGGGWSVVTGLDIRFRIFADGTCRVGTDFPDNLALIDTGASDVLIRAFVDLGISVARIVFRAQDATNYYFVDLDTNIGIARLGKREGASETILANDPTFPKDEQTVDFEIEASGDRLTFRDLTNNSTIVAFDTEFLSETKCGFGDHDSDDSWNIDYTISSASAPAAAPIQVEILTLVPPSSAQTVSYTHPNLAGRIPKGVVFYQINGDPTEFDAVFGVGAASSASDQWAAAMNRRDNTDDVTSGWNPDRCITCIDENATVGSRGDADFVAFIDGGFRLDWVAGTLGYDGTQLSSRTILAIIFSGDEMDCKALHHPHTPNPLDITTVGFEPDGLFTGGVSSTETTPSYFTSALGGFGWQDFAAVPPNMASLGFRTLFNGLGEVQTQRSASQTMIDSITDFGSFGQTARYTDPDASGMTARFDNGAGGSERVGVFAFRAGDGAIVKVGNLNVPTEPGLWKVTDPGFQPVFVGLIMQTSKIALDADTFFDANQTWGVGLFTEDNEFSIGISLEDANPTGDSESRFDTGKAASIQDTIEGQAILDGQFSSMNTDGWTLSFAAANGLEGEAFKWGYIAIGFPGPGVPPVSDGDQDPDVVCITSPMLDDEPSPPLTVRSVDQILAAADYHFDASQLTGFNDGDAITVLPDISGNGCNATQFLAGSDVYRAAASGINGLPAVELDGGSIYELPDACRNIGMPDIGLTIFVVRSHATGGTPDQRQVVPLAGKNFSGPLQNWDFLTDGFQLYEESDVIDPNQKAVGFESVEPRLDVGLWQPGVRTQVFRNGSLINEAVTPVFNLEEPPGSPIPTTVLSDGTGRRYKGFCGELLIFGRPLIIQERIALEQFLSTKWGLEYESTNILFYEDYESRVSGTVLTTTTPEFDREAGGWVSTNRNGRIFTTSGRNHTACDGGFVAASGGVVGAEVGRSDYIVKGNFTTFATGTFSPIGFFVRDSGNATLDGIEVALNNSTQDIEVAEWVAGVRTVIASASFPHFTSSRHHIRAELRGSSILVFVDGIQYITTTSSINPTEEKVGLTWWECTTGTRSEEIEVYR